MLNGSTSRKHGAGKPTLQKPLALLAVSLVLSSALPCWAQSAAGSSKPSGAATAVPGSFNPTSSPAVVTSSAANSNGYSSLSFTNSPADSSAPNSVSTPSLSLPPSATTSTAPADIAKFLQSAGLSPDSIAAIQGGRLNQLLDPKAADNPSSKTPTDNNGKALASAPDDSKSNGDMLSQLPGGAQRHVSPTTTVGTVKIRKPFKLFASEQLVHNMSFRDTPVREVIAEIARRGNLNILIDKSVTGKITGELRDVTLNEAMDSVLASAGLQSRPLENNTVVVATLQAMVQLGLNRPMARVFKLSYAHPYDVAMLLHASVFNKGILPDFTKTKDLNYSNSESNENLTETKREGGGSSGNSDEKFTSANRQGPDTTIDSERNTQVSRPDQQRIVRGSSRSQTQEGVGFNNAATDPGSQQIRAYQEINTDYIVEQNGGGAIVIPDVRNRQIMVVGTAEDIAVAEEAVHMIDRRPKQVHIQASLIELNNQGIRQLGATLNVQGQGAAASVLGNSTAPLVQYLPGLGSPGSTILNTQTSSQTATGLPAPALPFINGFTSAQSITSPTATNVTPSTPGTAFTGLIGSLLPVAPSIAGVTAAQTAQTGFNFLTLGRTAGGRLNIATLPSALGINLNLLLQTNKAKIISNPSVVVADSTEALVTIADEVIHKVTSTVSLGVVTTNVELTKAGVFLDVLPRLTEDGFVTMRLRPQVSAPLGPPQVFGSAASPTIVTLLSVREIMSQEVRVKDGQTLVLGGLFTEQEASQLAKVPYLAEAPVLGALFRNSLKGRNRTELILLLTPKVVEEEPGQIGEASPPVQM